MRHGTKKSLVITGAAIAGVIVLVLGAAAFLAATQAGLEIVVARALPANARVAKVEGTLLGPFTLRGIQLETGSARVRLDRVTVAWSPAALFAGKLHINRLTLAGLDITRLPGTRTASSAPHLPARVRLPLAVVVDKLDLEQARFYSGADAEPFVIDTATLSAKLTGRAMTVRHLAAHGPLFDLTGGASAVPAGRYPIAGKLDWTLRLPQYAPAEGTAALDGSLAALGIRLAVAAPYNAHAGIRLAALQATPRFDVKVALKGTRLHAVHAAWPAAVLNATATSRGTPKNLSYTLKADSSGNEIGRLTAALSGTYRDDVVTVASLRLTGPGKATATGHGRVSLGGARPVLDFNANWLNLGWPGTRVGSPRGEFRLSGTPANYRLAIDARMTAPGQTHGHVIVRGNGDRDSIKLTRIDLEALQGQLSGTAEARWKPAVSGRIALSGKNINPGLIAVGWPGKLKVQLRAHGAGEGDQFAANIETLAIDGRLRGYPVKLAAAGDYRNAILDLDKLILTSGPSRLDAHGRVGRQIVALQWRLESADLASLWPGAHGTLKGHGRISGTRDKPRVQAVADGTDISATLRGRRFSAQTLALNVDVDLAGKRRSQLALKLAQGEAGAVSVASLAFNGTGTPAHHRLTLAADTDRGRADLAVTGVLKDKQWRFRLTQATLTYPKLAPWQLAAPAGGRVSRDAFALSQTCWKSGGAKICVHASRVKQKLAGAFKLDDLSFAYFAPLLPDDVAVNGALDGSGRFERDGDALPVLHLDFNTTEGSLASNPATPNAQPANAATILEFAPSRLSLDLGHNGLSLDAALKLAGQGGLTVRARVPGGSAPLLQRPLDGDIRAELDDIGFIAKLKPSLGRFTGHVNGALHVGGSLAAPVLQGRLALSDGSARLRVPGITVTDITLALTGSPDGSIAITGEAHSGGGVLNIGGTADLVHRPRRATVQIRGDQFQAFDTVNGNVFISPDLNIALNGTHLNVTGTLNVPRAHITPKAIPRSAVGVSPDQVIVQPGMEKESTLVRQLSARIRLVLGDKVFFKGFGLSGRVEGNLLVTEEADQPPHGNGELHIVDGEYRAYGQGLVIETGRLVYAGGTLDEPGLDVRAVRHPAEDITVGVEVRGTLKQPDFKLYSEPAMTQAEQLSWLVLGRPLNNTSDAQGNALSRLALALGINQSNNVAKSIGKNLGVDTFAIQTGSQEAGSAQNTEQAALVIGKYLSPRLYVSYGIGLFEPINTVRLEYTLSSRWKLATESSSLASGGDLIYTLERR